MAREKNPKMLENQADRDQPNERENSTHNLRAFHFFIFIFLLSIIHKIMGSFLFWSEGGREESWKNIWHDEFKQHTTCNHVDVDADMNKVHVEIKSHSNGSQPLPVFENHFQVFLILNLLLNSLSDDVLEHTSSCVTNSIDFPFQSIMHICVWSINESIWFHPKIRKVETKSQFRRNRNRSRTIKSHDS